MKERHLPIYLLEEVACGLDAARAPRAGDHLAQCPACTERLRLIKADDEAFVRRHPPADFVHWLRGRMDGRADVLRQRIRLGGLAAVLACAAAYLLTVVWPAGPSARLGEASRARGTEVVVQTLLVQEGVLVPIQPEASVPEGSQVRFRIQTTEDAYGCIYHRSGNERRSLHPEARANLIRRGAQLVSGTFAMTVSEQRDYLDVALFRESVDCSAWIPRLDRGTFADQVDDGSMTLKVLFSAPLPKVHKRGHRR